MNKIADNQVVNIVNLGIPAISFYQYMDAYQFWGKQIEHDGVIFNIYLGNDLLDVAYKYVSNEVSIVKRTAIPSKFPLRMMDYIFAYYWTIASQATKDVGDGPYNHALNLLLESKFLEVNYIQLDNFDPEKVVNLQPGYEALIKFTQMVSQIKKMGKRVLIMLSPNQTQVETSLQAKLEERFNVDITKFDLELSAFLITQTIHYIDPGLPVLNLISSFRCAANEGQQLYYKTDTHWSVAGNQLAGENLAQYIATQWLTDTDKSVLTQSLQKCVVAQEILGESPIAIEKRTEIFKNFLVPLLQK